MKRLCIAALFGFVLVALASAQEDALSIIRAVDRKQHSNTSRTEITMSVYPDMHDDRNYREFKAIGISRGDDESYSEFLEPRSIRGLKILSRGGDSWIYFASTGRTRKIAGKAKKESVQGVGGDFSYEDMSGGTFERKYTFRILENGRTNWILEGLPKEQDSVYSKVVVTVDKSTMLPERVEYYTTDDGHYKELVLSDLRRMGGREIPTVMTMTNLKKGSKTVVHILAAEYNIPVDDRYFNPARFGR